MRRKRRRPCTFASDRDDEKLTRDEASTNAAPANTEELLELNYRWDHSRYLTITPRAQQLWKGESHESRNATILGIPLAITL